MVVKTETCFFSELKIYPGHGRRLVRRDGKLLIFIDTRSQAHYQNRKKAMRLRWTLAWRRANKKVKADKASTKKIVKKVAKTFKTFAGIKLEELNARRAAKSDYKTAVAEAAIRAAKADAAKAKAAKAANKGKKASAPVEVVRQPKYVKARIQAAVRK